MVDLRGHPGRALPPGQNFFIFMQFLEKIGQIVGWRPLRVSAAPLGNPGSATSGGGLVAFLAPVKIGQELQS